MLKLPISLPDVWYVNADGLEGWVPSGILQLLTDEDTGSSRESTPMDALSNEASADNSEMSDDGKNLHSCFFYSISYAITPGLIII